MKHIALMLGACLALTACGETAGDLRAKTSDMMGSAREYFAKFELTTAGITSLGEENLCPALGGTSVPPMITIQHSQVADIPITVRMYDSHSDGTVTEHGTVTVPSEEDGDTIVREGFQPPCNITAGQRDSVYKFDIHTKNSSMTLLWGGYASRDMEVILPSDIQ